MKLKEKIIIQLPVEKVFAFLLDVNNRKDYIPLLEEVIFLDPPPLQKGTRYTEVSTIAGRRLETTYQVIAFEENRRISVKTIKSVFPIQVTLSLLPLETETVIKLEIEFQLKGIFRLAAPLIEGIVQQQARDILQRMKRKMEAVA